MISLGTWILILSTILYFIAGVSFIFEAKAGLAITYIAYAVANIGLILVSIQGG
jgi:hypothetical protein